MVTLLFTKPMAPEQVMSDRDSEDEVDDDVADLEDRRVRIMAASLKSCIVSSCNILCIMVTSFF